MSCGNGCGCCSKCGCRATCTCNQSMWFDETMDDFRSYCVILMAGETGKLCAPFAACPSGTCASEDSFSTSFSSGEMMLMGTERCSVLGSVAQTRRSLDFLYYNYDCARDVRGECDVITVAR